MEADQQNSTIIEQQQFNAEQTLKILTQLDQNIPQIQEISSENQKQEVVNKNKGIDDYEADTIEKEELTNLEQLLLTEPNFQQCILNTGSYFSLEFSRLALDSWVRQDSACCAASVTVGCFNALTNRKRYSENAITTEIVLNVMINMVQSLVDSKKQSIQRLLQDQNIDNMLNQYEKFCQSQKNKSFGGMKELAITKKESIPFLIEMMQNNDYFCKDDNVFISLKELIEGKELIQDENSIKFQENLTQQEQQLLNEQEDLIQDDESLNQLNNQSNNNSKDNNTNVDSQFIIQFNNEKENILENKNVQNDYLLEDKIIQKKTEQSSNNFDENKYLSEEINNQNIAENSKIKKKKKKLSNFQQFKAQLKQKQLQQENIENNVASMQQKSWNWKKDFQELFDKMSGLSKLKREKPSTAIFGCWGIISSIKYLNEIYNENIKIDCLLARSGMKCDVPIKNNDDEEKIQLQWNTLRNAFEQKILIFHLTNHYSLIFGLRNYKNQKQILCARRGQRPQVWINFEEVRSIILNYCDYKILAFSNQKDQKIIQNN